VSCGCWDWPVGERGGEAQASGAAAIHLVPSPQFPGFPTSLARTTIRCGQRFQGYPLKTLPRTGWLRDSPASPLRTSSRPSHLPLRPQRPSGLVPPAGVLRVGDGEAWLPHPLPSSRPSAEQTSRAASSAKPVRLTRPARPAGSAGGTTARGWGQAKDPLGAERPGVTSAACVQGPAELGRFLSRYCAKSSQLPPATPPTPRQPQAARQCVGTEAGTGPSCAGNIPHMPDREDRQRRLSFRPVRLSLGRQREADRRAGELLVPILDAEGKAEVQALLAGGRFVPAVRRVRQLTGLRLIDAKRLAESLRP
jgi:hypothetical protein